MYISLNWLKDYVTIPENISEKELALKLTMATVEVDGVESLSKNLDNIVVGRILNIEKHPNADKLRIVKLSLGDRDAQIVCGGTNLREEMLVAVALPGAKVRWHGEGELVTLEKTSLRGVESEGMICASDELGLGALYPAGVGEIMDLTEKEVMPGENIAKALGLDDVIIEIDNKSLTNRPDLWGHYGLAREISAIYDTDLKDYAVGAIKPGKDVELKVTVENPTLCPRYMAVAVKNVKVGPSPDWLKRRLEAIGQKSINNIVDITNYIMFDLGQPLHAFSASKIADNEIIVRTAKEDEHFVSLDGVERKLKHTDLVIADKEKVVALAGVMGGENSEISENSDIIIIESANFEPVSIRKTAQRFALRTEAAIRFEKTLDPNYTELALKKAINLIQQSCPEAELISEIVDVKNFTMDQGPIDLRWDFINKRIGVTLEPAQVTKILTSLGFKVKSTKTNLKVTVPTWRATRDIKIKEDIIEEVTRIFGYDNLEPVMPAVGIFYPEQNKLRTLERRFKDILALSAGANEAFNHSFAEKDLLLKIGQPLVNYVELLNPWTENQNLMRRSLIPGLLKNVVDNLRFYEYINIFEVGKTFLPEISGEDIKKGESEKLPNQDLFAAGAVICEDPFYAAKELAEKLLTTLGFKVEYDHLETADVWIHPKQSLSVLVNKKNIGFISTMHPQVGNSLEINKKVGLWQLNLTSLVEFFPTMKKYEPLPKFPAIELDLSVIVSDDVQWKDLQNLVRAVDAQLIKKVELLDVYKGDKIELDKKSITFRTTYQSLENTLEMETVNKLQTKIIAQLEKALGVEVRN
jgi:phenylalanyl-tRNA synthetase beta chain